MSSKSRNARMRVKEDKYDTEAWSLLVREAQSKSGGIQGSREVFEEVLALFPTAAHLWKAYAEMELSESNIAELKGVFSRCLKGSCPSVDLWRTYLSFIKKTNDGRGGSGDAVQIQKAYEYTLDQIGNDISAGVIWQEYISFLKSAKQGSPAFNALFGGVAGQEDSKRTVALRRTYQKAISIPTNSIDNLWRSYETFEKDVAKHLAAPMLAEHKHKYQAAKTVFQERKKLLEGIKSNAMALPLSRKSEDMAKQAAIWRKYIEYELSNPQQLEKAHLQSRVGLAYDQALMTLYHYPDVWCEAASWHATHPLGGGASAAIQIFNKAHNALPGCAMLRYAAADVEEAALLAAREAGDDLEVERHMQAAECYYKDLVGEGETEGAAQQDPKERALSWIHYQRFVRRAKGTQEARQVFIRARKWPECPWQVYVASALMEWEHGREEKIARNIFENGLKKFLSSSEYIEAYANFLLGVGDVVNARTLFERALETPAPEVARPIWDRFLRFERRVGTTEACTKLEARRREALGEALPAADSLVVLDLRYRFLGLLPVGSDFSEYLEARVAGRPWEAPPTPAPQADSAPQRRPSPSPADNGQKASEAALGRAGPPPVAPHPRSPGVAPSGPVPPSGPAPPTRGGMPGGPSRPPPPGPNEPLKTLPPALGLFINALPQQAPDGKIPSADLVIEILLASDIDALMASNSTPSGPPHAESVSSGPGHPQGGRQMGPGGQQGKKRKSDAPEPGPALENRPPAFDIYRQRRRQQMAQGGAN